MRLCVGLGMHSEFLMTELLRIMANLMRPDSLGAAEVGYLAMEATARLLPAPVARVLMGQPEPA